MTTTPTPAEPLSEIAKLRAALLECARKAEALKRECGMDPESPQAVRNLQYQSISTTAHIALGTIRGPAPEIAQPATPEPPQASAPSVQVVEPATLVYKGGDPETGDQCTPGVMLPDGSVDWFDQASAPSVEETTEQHDQRHKRAALARTGRGHAWRLREIATFLRSTKRPDEADAAIQCDAAARWVESSCQSLTQASALQAAIPAQQPVAWVRFCSDGCYEGPIMDCAMEEVRKKSGAWTPLYASPTAQPGEKP